MADDAGFLFHVGSLVDRVSRQAVDALGADSDIPGFKSKRRKRKQYVIQPDIPRLIKVAGSPNPKRCDKAIADLIKFTWCDFGDDVDEWYAWYDENKDGTRFDWAADALEDGGYEMRNLPLGEFIPQCIRALGDQDWIFRSAAFYLLQLSTGQQFHFPAKASAGTREKHCRTWAEWWTRKGREFIRMIESAD